MKSKYKPRLKDYTSTLSQMPSLKELTIHTGAWSSLREVEEIFRQIVEHGGSKQRLNSLTLHQSPGVSEWHNPWGTVREPSRVFQKIWRTNVGSQKGARRSARWPKKPALEIHARQTHGPPPVRSTKKIPREKNDLLAEKATEDYLDATPPAVLSQLVEASESHLPSPSSDREDYSYSTQTGGWKAKLAEYEAKLKKDSGFLPLLESQLQKRKERGWKLWDMPLMESEVEQEGFLYDRIMEAGAGN